jgi:hypothetical protein
MAKSWGRRTITNADKRHLTQTKYMAPDEHGVLEERIDRRPMGKVEKFVDNEGGVVSLQIYADGDAKRHETEIRRRAELHRKGFVEHAKCPLKHGTRHSSPAAAKDFAKALTADLQTECKHDIKAMSRVDGDLVAGKACPHIEALIAYRRKVAKEAFEKRNAQRAAAEKREAEKAQLAEKQTMAIEALLAERAERKPKSAPKAGE